MRSILATVLVLLFAVEASASSVSNDFPMEGVPGDSPSSEEVRNEVLREFYVEMMDRNARSKALKELGIVDEEPDHFISEDDGMAMHPDFAAKIVVTDPLKEHKPPKKEKPLEQPLVSDEPAVETVIEVLPEEPASEVEDLQVSEEPQPEKIVLPEPIQPNPDVVKTVTDYATIEIKREEADTRVYDRVNDLMSLNFQTAPTDVVRRAASVARWLKLPVKPNYFVVYVDSKKDIHPDQEPATFSHKVRVGFYGFGSARAFFPSAYDTTSINIFSVDDFDGEREDVSLRWKRSRSWQNRGQYVGKVSYVSESVEQKGLHWRSITEDFIGNNMVDSFAGLTIDNYPIARLPTFVFSPVDQEIFLHEQGEEAFVPTYTRLQSDETCALKLQPEDGVKGYPMIVHGVVPAGAVDIESVKHALFTKTYDQEWLPTSREAKASVVCSKILSKSLGTNATVLYVLRTTSDLFRIKYGPTS